MTKEEAVLIAHKLSRAREALDEAQLMLDADHLNAYVNRLYYACFYAVSGLLRTKEISSSKHAYVRAKFHQEFVKPRVVGVDMGKHSTCFLKATCPATTRT